LARRGGKVGIGEIDASRAAFFNVWFGTWSGALLSLALRK